MNPVVQLFEKTLPVFVMLCLGMLCRRRKLLTREDVNALKNVAVNIALPAVMFSAFASAEYTVRSICVPLVIFAVCLASLYLGHILCRVMKIRGINVRVGEIRITCSEQSLILPEALMQLITACKGKLTYKQGKEPQIIYRTTGLNIDALAWLEKHIPALASCDV